MKEQLTPGPWAWVEEDINRARCGNTQRSWRRNGYVWLLQSLSHRYNRHSKPSDTQWDAHAGVVIGLPWCYIKGRDVSSPVLPSAPDKALIAAAPDLLAAAKLAVENFERQNLHPEVNFLGDDDHEAWTALRAAIAKAEAA